MPRGNRKPWELTLNGLPPQQSPRELALHFLRFAVLAPSSHNSQPWKFKVGDDGTVEFFADKSRQLAVADPHGRELVISMGALVKLYLLAAEYHGVDAETELFPDGEDSDLIARVRLVPGGFCAPLAREIFPAVLDRRTTRDEFAREDVTDEMRQALRQLLDGFRDVMFEFVSDPTARNSLAELVAEANRVQFENAEFRNELAAWLRPNFTAKGDGLTGEPEGISAAKSAFAGFAVRKFASSIGPAHARQEKLNTRHAPMLVVMGTPADEPRLWAAVGGAALCLHLLATRFFLKMAYLNAPLQVPELRTLVQENLFNEDMVPQLIVRLGFAPPAPPSPRRALEDMLLR